MCEDNSSGIKNKVKERSMNMNVTFYAMRSSSFNNSMLN